MISVVSLFQLGRHFFRGRAIFLRQESYTGSKAALDFILGKTAKRRVLIVHGDVIKVVQGAEQAHLAEFCDAGQENETKIRLQFLER